MNITIISKADIESLTLLYLQYVCSREIVPGLKWSSFQRDRTLTVELKDKLTREQTNVYPAVLLSIGGSTTSPITFQNMLSGSPIISEDKKRIIQKDLHTMSSSVNFEVEVRVANRRQCVDFADKLVKHIVLLSAKLKVIAGVNEISAITQSPPQNDVAVTADAYKVTIGYRYDLIEVIREEKERDLIKQFFLEFVANEGQVTPDFEMWVGSTPEYNDVPTGIITTIAIVSGSGAPQQWTSDSDTVPDELASYQDSRFVARYAAGSVVPGSYTAGTQYYIQNDGTVDTVTTLFVAGTGRGDGGLTVAIHGIQITDVSIDGNDVTLTWKSAGVSYTEYGYETTVVDTTSGTTATFDITGVVRPVTLFVRDADDVTITDTYEVTDG